ncbi:diguanylate cyclase [Vibrio vulnificus]
MCSLKSLSIKNKLLLPILLFGTLIFLIAQGFHFWASYEKDQQLQNHRISILAYGAAQNLQAAVLFNDQKVMQEILDSFSIDPSILIIELRSLEGNVLSRYQRDMPVNADNHVLPLPYPFETFITYSQRIDVEQNAIATLSISASTQTLEQMLTRLLESSVVFLAVLLLSGSTLYLIVQKVVIDPVYKLNESMQDLVEGRIKGRSLVSHTSDEMGELVNAFNAMSQRLALRDSQLHHTLDRLEHEKAFATDVIEAVQTALLVVNEHGDVLHHNAAARTLFQADAQRIAQHKLSELMLCKEPSFVTNALTSKNPLEERLVECRLPTGSKLLVKISTRILSKRGATLFSIQDVTEIETALNRQRIAAGVFENSEDGLVVLDHNGLITMTNPAVTRMLGYPQEILIGKSLLKAFDWQQIQIIMPTIQESLEHYGQWQGEVLEKHYNGNLIPMFAKVSRISKKVGVQEVFDMVIILSDLSGVKEMERLEYLAHHDALTGLANRAKLHRTLEDELKLCNFTHSEFALFYMDLDGFKFINDTFGHDTGDHVLKVVSERLLNEVRSGDLVARLSGDEFVLLIKRADNHSVTLLSERILESLREPIEYLNQTMQVGCSIGVKLVGPQEKDMERILKSADTAMYKAKKSGKGQAILIGAEVGEACLSNVTSE